MKAFFLKIGLLTFFCSILFIAFFAFLLPNKVIESNDSYIDRWNQFYTTSTNSDIIILGSSRAHRHCNPDIIAKKLNMTAQVIAIGGAKFDFLEALYDDYLQNNLRPKVFIFNLDLTGLDDHPYVPHPEFFIPSVTSKSSLLNFEKIKYFGEFKPIGYFHLKDIYFDIIENPDREVHVNGFLARDIKWDGSYEEFIAKNPNGITFEISNNTINRICLFLKNIASQGTKVIAIISPEYNEAWKYQNNRLQANNYVKKVLSKYGIKLYDFSSKNYGINFKKNLFYNSQHLNLTGANYYSTDLGDSVMRYLQIPNK